MASTLENPKVFTVAGGKRTRLQELTAHDRKPAVHFAGCGRIIDDTFANVVRAGLARMLVATRYEPRTLYSYLPAKWSAAFPDAGLATRERREVTGHPDSYQGTACAVAVNLPEIAVAAPTDVPVLADCRCGHGSDKRGVRLRRRYCATRRKDCWISGKTVASRRPGK